MFLHLCVDRAREKIFHEKTGLRMFGDDRGQAGIPGCECRTRSLSAGNIRW
jgi:hypothetical protein